MTELRAAHPRPRRPRAPTQLGLVLAVCAMLGPSCGKTGQDGARAYLEEQGFTRVDVSPQLVAATPGMQQEAYLFTARREGQECRGTVTGQSMLGCSTGFAGVWDCGALNLP